MIENDADTRAPSPFAVQSRRQWESSAWAKNLLVPAALQCHRRGCNHGCSRPSDLLSDIQSSIRRLRQTLK